MFWTDRCIPLRRHDQHSDFPSSTTPNQIMDWSIQLYGKPSLWDLETLLLYLNVNRSTVKGAYMCTFFNKLHWWLFSSMSLNSQNEYDAVLERSSSCLQQDMMFLHETWVYMPQSCIEVAGLRITFYLCIKCKITTCPADRREPNTQLHQAPQETKLCFRLS